MPFANGYEYRKELSLTSSGLTGYSSTPEDGIVVHIGTGTDAAADVYIPAGHCQDSLIDVILTDGSDNLVPFEWVHRKPGDYGRLIWSKSAVASSDTLRLYYGKADATYQGDDVGDVVDRLQDYSKSLTHDPWGSGGQTYTSDSSAKIQVKNGFAFFAISDMKGTSARKRLFGYKYDLFTRSIVDKVFLGTAGSETDNHDHVTLLVDASGYLWAFRPQYGTGGPIQYQKSDEPYSFQGIDDASWIAIAETDVNNLASYPQPYQMPNGDIWLFFRDVDFCVVKSADGGASWARTIVVSAPATERVYGWVTQSEQGDLLLSYSYAALAGAGWHDLGFLWYDRLAAEWKSASGTTLTLPATSSDASYIENSGADPRITSANGPFVTSGGFGFVYAHGGATPWFTGDLRARIWNGSAWVDYVILSGVDGDFSAKCFYYESAGIPHLVVSEAVSAGNRNLVDFSAPAWGSAWALYSTVKSGLGNLREPHYPNHSEAADGLPLAVCADLDGSGAYLVDLLAPVYGVSWSVAGQSELLAGTIRGIATAAVAGASSYAHRSISAVSPARLDARWYYNDSGARAHYSAFGLFSEATDKEPGTQEYAGLGFEGLASPSAPTLSVSTRDDGANGITYSAVSPAANQRFWFAVEIGAANVSMRVASDPEMSAVVASATRAATPDALSWLGFAHAAPAGSFADRYSQHFIGQLRYYKDQSANAPTYSAWGAEETNSGATLSVSSALHAHTAGQPSLLQAQVLSPAGATHGHAAEQPSLSAAVTLVTSDASQAHAASQPVLTQSHVLAVLSATQAQAADGATLTVAGALNVSSALHGHLAGLPLLTQAHSLQPADAVQAQVADQVALDLSVLLVPSAANHQHAAAEPALVQAQMLSAHDALQAELAGLVGLSQGYTLIASDALHAQLADNAALLFGEIVSPSGRVFLVRADRRVFLVN